MSESSVWQDVEFGSYTGDMPLWEELAEAAGGPVLELGAGSGRVSIHLARRGASVVAVERDPDLASELARRADREDLPIEVIQGDMGRLGSLGLGRAPTLAIAPLHVIQQVEPADRSSLLGSLAGLLAGGGTFAATVVDESSFLAEGIATEAAGATSPDMRDLNGWVYSSEPLWVQVDEDTLRVRRLRQRVPPDGELERSVHDELLYRLSPEKLQLDALQAGFEARERRAISSGAREANSVAIVVEAP